MKHQPIIRLIDPFIELFTDSPYSFEETWIARIVISLLLCLFVLCFVMALMEARRQFWRWRAGKAIARRQEGRELAEALAFAAAISVTQERARARRQSVNRCQKCGGAGVYLERSETSAKPCACPDCKGSGLLLSTKDRPKGNDGEDCQCSECVRYFGESPRFEKRLGKL